MIITKIKPRMSGLLTEYEVEVDGVILGTVFKYRKATNYNYGKRYIVRTTHGTYWKASPRRYGHRFITHRNTRHEAIDDLIGAYKQAELIE